MPSRHINFTGRQRISTSDVTIELHNEAIPPVFKVPHFSLQSYGLPAEALVCIEAYHRTDYMRFELGTVADITVPESFVLTKFGSPDGIRFRVKVTSVTDPTAGQLLAEGSGISPVWLDDVPESLLPVEPTDLGQEVFRLYFQGGPVLQINENIVHWKEVVRSDYFRSLVYPIVLRSLLTQLLREGIPDSDDNDDWRFPWLRFAQDLPDVAALPDPNDDYEIDQWVNGVVSSFSRASHMYDIFSKRWNAEVSI